MDGLADAPSLKILKVPNTASLRSFPNQLPFKLGRGAKDVEQEPALWNPETFNFTAASSTTQLNITGLSTAGGEYIGLDNADVEIGTNSTVPEPGTYTFVLAGIGLLGWVARRRKISRR